MRDHLVVGILRETKGFEHRSPLVPSDVEWLSERGVTVEVESSPHRAFGDREFKKCGARMVNKVSEAKLLVGIKEPRVHDLHANKIYMVFSHTAKGQPHNMPLLRTCLKKKITLIDYEQIVDLYGSRLVFFGRFAGICGMTDSLHYLGRKLASRGIKNPFELIKPAFKYESLEVLKKSIVQISQNIKSRGFGDELSPFVVGITGHGNVSRGAQEVLDLLNPVEIHPKDMKKFIEHQRKQRHRVYKIVFLREEKFRSRAGKGFYFEDYLRNPKQFESNLDNYLPYINLLMHTAYWDSKFPRLVPKKMINSLAGRDPFRLQFIGDLSCDVKGSVEITYKTTSPDKPVFTYDHAKKKYIDGFRSAGVTVLAVDNLPAELPKDASDDFSSLIRDYVYQIAAHGVTDITDHMAIPAEIRNAVVTQNGRLTKKSAYLKRFISS
jgi:alpha-aminoadipic semialdehyde synthase